ncbi:MAG: flagellar hook-length control protein FliK [Pseudomonadales bacterium]|nr:flagellar hook-length control protein FliK [Pseudomonadales bacterium]
MPGPIPPSTLLTNSPVIQATSGALPSLKTGSIVTAQVVRTDVQNPQTSKEGMQRLQLRLEGQLIAVSSNKPMQPGTTVKLQVTGPNQWLLLPSTTSAKPQPAALNTWTQATRQSMPAQAELGLVIKTLLAQSSSLNSLGKNSALSSMAKILLANNSQLISSMLSKQDLSNPSNISKAIKNSGLMFESKILPKSTPTTLATGQQSRAGSPINTGTAIAGDLKSILLKTVHQLTVLKPALNQSSTQVTSPQPSRQSQSTQRPTDPLVQPGRSQQTSGGAEQSSATRPTTPFPANLINPSLIRQTLGAATSPLPNRTAIPGATQSGMATTLAVPTSHQTPAPFVTKVGSEAPQQAIPRGAELVEMVLKQLNGGLSKILFQQLQSVGSQNQWSNPANIQNSWLLDLPIFNNPNIDSFNIRIDQEDAQNGQENAQIENGWVITLRFDLDKLGPITVRARLVGLQVSMDIWSQRPAILSMIQKEFVSFEQALIAKGLDVKSLACYSGELKEPRPVVEQSLLHVET